MLLQELGKISFAAWEITLFLDTHPFHSEALEYRNHYEKTARALRMEYEQKIWSSDLRRVSLFSLLGLDRRPLALGI